TWQDVALTSARKAGHSHTAIGAGRPEKGAKDGGDAGGCRPPGRSVAADGVERGQQVPAGVRRSATAGPACDRGAGLPAERRRPQPAPRPYGNARTCRTRTPPALLLRARGGG